MKEVEEALTLLLPLTNFLDIGYTGRDLSLASQRRERERSWGPYKSSIAAAADVLAVIVVGQITYSCVCVCLSLSSLRRRNTREQCVCYM